MALQITETPFLYGWAKNRNRLTLKADGLQLSAGSKSHFSWSFPSASLGTDGHHVVLSIDGMELVYTIGDSADSYSARTRAKLASLIAGNYYVQELFDTSYTSSSVELSAKEVGRHSVELFFTDGQGTRTDTLKPSSIEEGSDRTVKPNYAVLARVEVVVNDYNKLSTYLGGDMVFNPDTDGNVHIDLDILRDFIPQPDLPSVGSDPWRLLTNALLKYRIHYAEMWGDTSPLVQNSGVTDWFYALCGEAEQRYASLNLPDWRSGQRYQLIDYGDLFWVIGEDTGETVTIRQSQTEYLYGLFCSPSFKIGEPLSSAYDVSLSIVGFRADGTSETLESNHSIVNGQVYRIDVSASLLSDDILWYSVVVRSNGGSWQRIYHVLPDFDKQHRFLLQNKYGLLVPVACGVINAQVETEADPVYKDRRRYLSISQKSEVLTAVMHYVSPYMARRVARCVGNDYHYILLGGRYVRITIEPDTFSSRDEEEGLVDLSFKFRFVEDQQENTRTGDATRTTAIRQDDFMADRVDEIVDFAGIFLPDYNKIF